MFGSRFHEISPLQLSNSLAQGQKMAACSFSRETGGDWTMFEDYLVEIGVPMDTWLVFSWYLKS